MVLFKSSTRRLSTLKPKITLCLASLAVLFSSCADFDQFNDMQVDPFSPEFGFPILNSEVTLEELLDVQEGQNLSYI